MRKTWKIGEYCKGGIISVDVKKSEVILYLKEWDHSKGSNRGSNQSNAKVLEKISIDRRIPWNNETFLYERLERFLTDWTTPYYADTIITWIKEHVKEGN